MKTPLLALALGTALTFSADATAAQDLSYTFLQGSYNSTDLDGVGNLEGTSIEASWGASNGLHFFGGADRFTGGDDRRTETTSWYAGAGVVYPISFRTHLVIRAAYVKAEQDDQAVDYQGMGPMDAAFETQYTWGELGVRAVLGESAEGWVMGRYSKVEDAELTAMSVNGVLVSSNVDITDQLQDDEYTSARAGVMWKFHPVWSVGAEAQSSNNFNGFSAFLRSSF